MRRLFKIALVVCGLYLVLSAIAGVVIAEASLKLNHRPLGHQREAAEQARLLYGARLEDVTIQSADGLQLKAWYIHPANFNGSAVLLLHGITDKREGVAGYAKLFLDHGYSVLLPDARDHGESGGRIATYGLKESMVSKRLMTSTAGCLGSTNTILRRRAVSMVSVNPTAQR